MAVHVLNQGVRFNATRTRAVVTIESDLTDFALAIEELQKSSTKQMALNVVAGLGLDALSNTLSPAAYPVNQHGERVMNLIAGGLDPTDPRAQPARYRVDLEVARSGSKL